MKKIILAIICLSICSCATYVLPDGTVVSSGIPARPTVTPYYTGYLNPWAYGTSGSYGGGYYPIYGGAWNNYNAWNCNRTVYRCNGGNWNGGYRGGGNCHK